MELSEFTIAQMTFPDAEPLPVSGATCDCYRVKLYGKLHFMKRLKPELSTDPRYVAALQKEFETGYRLDHSHLVRYVAKGDDYLLTEYVDGLTLEAFVEENPDYFKSVQNTNRFLTQLLEVVGYLHQHQVIHLDLKPSNILITRIGHEMKLTDLGFCYTDTYSDTMGRTDKYAAPEQLEGSSTVDARTDIYAIGKILQALPCSHKYNKVIARCTTDVPSKRYQNIEDLQKALKPSPHYRFMGIAAILMTTVLVGLYFMLHRNQQPEVVPQVVEQPMIPRDTQSSHTDDKPTLLPPPSTKSQNSKTVSSVEPEANVNNHPAKQELLSSSEQLKADIKAAVLPKFNATMGALPDSVKPGTEQWAQAGWALERELSNTLQELFLSHQDIPMQTIAQEYTAYLQALITQKYHQNSQTP